jgi:Kef-type K+ transport system membrane component KefB
MKNFFASGLFFLAIGSYRLQQQVFPGKAFWPILLLVSGLVLMQIAVNYAPLKVVLARSLKKLRLP